MDLSNPNIFHDAIFIQKEEEHSNYSQVSPRFFFGCGPNTEFDMLEGGNDFFEATRQAIILDTFSRSILIFLIVVTKSILLWLDPTTNL